MFAAIDATLAELYPERRWRAPRPSDAAPRLADAAALADELADVLRTATFVRPPVDGGAAYVYVLCLGRPPSAGSRNPRRRAGAARRVGAGADARGALPAGGARRGGAAGRRAGDRGRCRGRRRGRGGARARAGGRLLAELAGAVPEGRGHAAGVRSPPPRHGRADGAAAGLRRQRLVGALRRRAGRGQLPAVPEPATMAHPACGCRARPRDRPRPGAARGAARRAGRAPGLDRARGRRAATARRRRRAHAAAGRRRAARGRAGRNGPRVRRGRPGARGGGPRSARARPGPAARRGARCRSRRRARCASAIACARTWARWPSCTARAPRW